MTSEWLRTASPDALVFHGLSSEEAIGWVEKSRTLRTECGCATGARFFVAAAGLYPVAWYVAFPSSAAWITLPLWPASMLIAGFVGKSIGVLFARIELCWRLRTLSDRLSVRASSETQTP